MSNRPGCACVICPLITAREAVLVNDELEQVLVRIPRVDTHTGRPATTSAAVTLNRSLNQYRPGVFKHGARLFDGAVPHEAEVTAAGYSSGTAQGKGGVLPDRRRVHVDLRVAEGEGERPCLALPPRLLVDHRKAEALVEVDHLLGLCRGDGRVVERCYRHVKFLRIGFIRVRQG